MVKLRKLKCKRCEHEWLPRTEYPTVCPNCKSPYWDTPRKNVKGLVKK